ncbi:MAG: hypothetical protein IT349_13455 [Candidatus Eisenbacteria bacterium]|nr:hypothetical protein [Candidatus Eisenbacteria bacterium]
MRLIPVISVLALLEVAGSAAAQTGAPWTAAAPDVRRWAANSLSTPASSGRWPAAWSALESGDLDQFMAKARDYTRVFPSPERQVAAVVTWSRPADPERGLEVTARVSVRMVDGAELRSFPIEPLSAVDITDDGAFVVAHGEQMSRLIQCGVQQTRLAFYDGVGRELARFEPLDLSPSYSTAILTDARRFVITATGRVIAYDLSGTGVIWTLPLERRSDRPFLSLDARAERLAVVVHQPSGGAQIRTLDRDGVELGNRTLRGRVNPGSGITCRDDLWVVQEIQDDLATYHLLESATLRTLRSVASN